MGSVKLTFLPAHLLPRAAAHEAAMAALAQCRKDGYKVTVTVLNRAGRSAAVLLALRAFAQAAQAGTTTPPQVPHIQERPDAQALFRQGDPLIGESPMMR